MDNRPDWYEEFTERQIKEIELAILYARDFNHGTDGHNAKVIISRMAEMITALEQNGGYVHKEPK